MARIVKAHAHKIVLPPDVTVLMVNVSNVNRAGTVGTVNVLDNA